MKLSVCSHYILFALTLTVAGQVPLRAQAVPLTLPQDSVKLEFVDADLKAVI